MEVPAAVRKKTDAFFDFDELEACGPIKQGELLSEKRRDDAHLDFDEMEEAKKSESRSSCRMLEPGQRVVIEGLKTHNAFNGLRGIIELFDEATGRYNVQLGSDIAQTAKIKGENLRALVLQEPKASPLGECVDASWMWPRRIRTSQTATDVILSIDHELDQTASKDLSARRGTFKNFILKWRPDKYPDDEAFAGKVFRYLMSRRDRYLDPRLC
ncbi:KCNJ11 [Symbiodinium natans]|uniref:KCNJ11 protein n=1 Tax=Symbiodinium natans TaxID=878477 RepID=A0A812J8U1_9DINO|nr:KCNJ11 [Symbiodinium natans]